MTRYYCHECSHEGSDFATSPGGFTCPRCGGAFVEEIPDNDGMADDPREFDPVDEDDEEHHPFGFFRSASGAANNDQAPNQAGNGRFFHYESPGGGFVFTGGFGGAGGAQAPQHPGASNPLAYSLMQAFGLAPPAQGPQAAAAVNADGSGRADSGEGRPQARRWQSAGANEPANRQQQHGQGQVPIQNLATFLNDAFGGPHPADDPGNNPFAEGGHETGPEPEEEQGHAGNRGAAQHPLGALFSLFGQVLGGHGGGFGLPTHANAGDYVWGSEANFQQLLNDLMEQAAGRAGPQPAPDDMIEKLPRLKISQDVLDMDSITTCGVCLDAFQLDDAAVALPCKHLYHEDCLVPWLKTSGTCPICRYALVPQPGQPGYGEEGQGAQQPPATGPTPSGFDPEGDGTSASAAAASDGAAGNGLPPPPPRPPLSTRPSTAQIPDVEGGSTLPGSWVWPAGGGEVDHRTPAEQNALTGEYGEDAMAPDSRDPEDAPLIDSGATSSSSGGGTERVTSVSGEESARSAARAAAEAAERRRAAEAEERKRQQAPTTPAADESSSTSIPPTSSDAPTGSSSSGTEQNGPIIEDVD